MATIHDLCAEISGRREKHFSHEPIRPQHVPRASAISDCRRQMLLEMTHWQQRKAPDAYLAQRFRRGHQVEEIVKRELSELGMEVTESQMAGEVRDVDGTLLCTLHIDGRLRWSGLAPVFECKSLNPNIWGRITSIDDFPRIGTWARKYPRQLLMYMYAYEEPHGVLVADDCLGHWKALPISLEDHVDECVEIMGWLRDVVDAKAGKYELDPIDDPTLCSQCWAHAAGICLPAMNFKQKVTLVDNTKLREAFETIRETAEDAADYKVAEKLVKEYFKARGPGQYLVESTLVDVNEQGRTDYPVPQEIKDLYAEASKATVVKWEFLD